MPGSEGLNPTKQPLEAAAKDTGALESSSTAPEGFNQEKYEKAQGLFEEMKGELGQNFVSVWELFFTKNKFSIEQIESLQLRLAAEALGNGGVLVDDDGEDGFTTDEKIVISAFIHSIEKDLDKSILPQGKKRMREVNNIFNSRIIDLKRDIEKRTKGGMVESKPVGSAQVKRETPSVIKKGQEKQTSKEGQGAKQETLENITTYSFDELAKLFTDAGRNDLQAQLEGYVAYSSRMGIPSEQFSSNPLTHIKQWIESRDNLSDEDKANPYLIKNIKAAKEFVTEVTREINTASRRTFEIKKSGLTYERGTRSAGRLPTPSETIDLSTPDAPESEEGISPDSLIWPDSDIPQAEVVLDGEINKEKLESITTAYEDLSDEDKALITPDLINFVASDTGSNLSFSRLAEQFNVENVVALGLINILVKIGIANKEFEFAPIKSVVDAATLKTFSDYMKNEQGQIGSDEVVVPNVIAPEVEIFETPVEDTVFTEVSFEKKITDNNQSENFSITPENLTVEKLKAVAKKLLEFADSNLASEVPDDWTQQYVDYVESLTGLKVAVQNSDYIVLRSEGNEEFSLAIPIVNKDWSKNLSGVVKVFTDSGSIWSGDKMEAARWQVKEIAIGVRGVDAIGDSYPAVFVEKYGDDIYGDRSEDSIDFATAELTKMPLWSNFNGLQQLAGFLAQVATIESRTLEDVKMYANLTFGNADDLLGVLRQLGLVDVTNSGSEGKEKVVNPATLGKVIEVIEERIQALGPAGDAESKVEAVSEAEISELISSATSLEGLRDAFESFGDVTVITNSSGRVYSGEDIASSFNILLAALDKVYDDYSFFTKEFTRSLGLRAKVEELIKQKSAESEVQSAESISLSFGDIETLNRLIELTTITKEDLSYIDQEVLPDIKAILDEKGREALFEKFTEALPLLIARMLEPNQSQESIDNYAMVFEVLASKDLGSHKKIEAFIGVIKLMSNA